MSPNRRVPCARRQVTEPNQEHLVAATMSCDSQQIIHAIEPRFTREIVRDVAHPDRSDRIHDDVAVIHPVTTTYLGMGSGPDANSASDSPASYSLPKGFSEKHLTSPASRRRHLCPIGHDRPGPRDRRPRTTHAWIAHAAACALRMHGAISRRLKPARYFDRPGGPCDNVGTL